MRAILIFIISVVFGKIISSFGLSFGFQLAFVMMFVGVLFPIWYKFFSISRCRNKVVFWAEKNLSKPFSIDVHYTFGGKLKWKASDAQIVFSIISGEEKYWFSFGSWWFGLFFNGYSIYVERDGEVFKLRSMGEDGRTSE